MKRVLLAPEGELPAATRPPGTPYPMR